MLSFIKKRNFYRKLLVISTKKPLKLTLTIFIKDLLNFTNIFEKSIKNIYDTIIYL